jgi:hypothetical protein
MNPASACAALMPHALLHSSRVSFFISCFLYFLLPRRSIMLFIAGDLAQLHLPVGMKDLYLPGTGVTGRHS